MNTKLSDIQEMWKKDCKIDDIELDASSLQVPVLHAKYSEILANQKLIQIRYENQLKDLQKDKWLWYTGKLNQEEIQEKNWDYDPFNGLTILLSCQSDKAIYGISNPDEHNARYLDLITKMAPN